MGLRRRRWGSEGSVASLVWAAAGALLRRRGGQVAGRDNRTCSKAVLLWMNRKLSEGRGPVNSRDIYLLFLLLFIDR